MHPVLLFLFKIVIYTFTLLYSVGFLIWLIIYATFHPFTKFWKVKNREKPPPRMLDNSWGQHEFMQLQDVRLHYVENGNKNKPLMLFIHGFPEFWYSWRYQLRDLSQDYWTVALDLRGYGESDKLESQSSYKMKKIIDDIYFFILGLGKDEVILVGHDWGGLLVWNFLDYYSFMVKKYVVINSPHHRTWTKLIAINPKQFIASWYCFFFQIPVLPEFALSLNDFSKFHILIDEKKGNKKRKVSNEDLEVFKYTFSRPNALKYPVDYYRANCGELYVKEEPLKVYPPGLLLFGENDDYLSLRFVDLAKREVPNLKSKIIENSSHFVQQESPDEVNEEIKKFVSEETV